MSVSGNIIANLATTLKMINGNQNATALQAQSGWSTGMGQTMGPGKYTGPVLVSPSSSGSSAIYNNIIREAQVTDHAIYENAIPDDAFPHFAIVFNGETREKEPGRLKKVCSIDIVCHFIQPGHNEVESWLSDVELVLAQDITRGRNAYETWIPSIQRNSDVSAEIQIYIINVECRTLVNFGEL